MRNLICNYCGKHFKSKNFKKYCSNECREKARKQKSIRIKKICLQCGKEFYVLPCLSYRKFCTSKCANKYNSKVIKKKLRKRIIVFCDNCGKKIEITPSKFKSYKTHFCSRKCLGSYTIKRLEKEGKIHIKGKKAWNKGIADIYVKCLNCGKIFKSLKCEKRKFCSHKCALDYVRKNRVSTLEKIIEKVLKDMNILYIPQYPYNNERWYADFYLPQYKLFIECDGSYWHNLSDRRKIDLEKDAWIMANGYNILRLSEDLIRKEIDKCIQKIKSFTLKEVKNGRD